MSSSPLIDDIQLLINDHIKELTIIVASGSCKSIEQYKDRCGQIDGLNRALEIIAKAEKAYINDDD